MVLDVVDSVLEVSVAFGQVSDQQVLHDRLRVPWDSSESTEEKAVLVEIPRELDLPLQDLLVDRHRVLVGERVDPGIHFVDQDAQSPPINRFPVAC